MLELSWLKDLTGIIQSALTTLAILAGGGFALYKLKQFRDLEPHLTISHSINHRPIGGSYVHIDVAFTLHNSSRVKVELREGFFVVQQIAPAFNDNTLLEQNLLYPGWPVLAEASFDLGEYGFLLEPGQSLQDVLQFTVPRDVSTVLVHYFFYDNRYTTDSRSGWGITEVYDIIDNEIR